MAVSFRAPISSAVPTIGHRAPREKVVGTARKSAPLPTLQDLPYPAMAESSRSSFSPTTQLRPQRLAA
jgi:hypothetical protein